MVRAAFWAQWGTFAGNSQVTASVMQAQVRAKLWAMEYYPAFERHSFCAVRTDLFALTVSAIFTFFHPPHRGDAERKRSSRP
jgi:hypothetical protein